MFARLEVKSHEMQPIVAKEKERCVVAKKKRGETHMSLQLRVYKPAATPLRIELKTQALESLAQGWMRTTQSLCGSPEPTVKDGLQKSL